MFFLGEKKLSVSLLKYTPDPQEIVAMGAKLCYSGADIEALKQGIVSRDQAPFLERLMDLSHLSPIEHASFTFGIEGVSRSLLAQITRHRIASFSVKSQRYVPATQAGGTAGTAGVSVNKVNLIDAATGAAAGAANPAVTEVGAANPSGALANGGCSAFPSAATAAGATGAAADGAGVAVEADGVFGYIIPPQIKDLGPGAVSLFESQMRQIQAWYNEWVEKLGNQGEKSFEDARFVLPNAAETKMLVTMNARELLHFFTLRCCNRAQWEIRALAREMLKLVKPVAPVIFKEAGPACLKGPCPEGKMSCGKREKVRKEFLNP